MTTTTAATPADAADAPDAPDGPDSRTDERAPRALVLLLAVACGLTVANLYYAQPLLATIAHDLGIGTGTAGLLITVTQLGYAVGLALVVPLGDLLPRRRLVVGVLFVTVAALLATAFAPGVALLGAALAVVGLTSVVAQILVPFAAGIAGESERGRVVGTVMSGLLLGILLARTMAGLIAAALGWRAVFAISAALMLGLAGVLARRLPELPVTATLSYPRLLASVGSLIGTHAALRRRMAYGAAVFAAFSVFWTSSAFLLAGPHYGYSEGVIGLFGLVGVAGALCAQVSGRLADRGLARAGTGVYLALILASFGVLALGRGSVVALIVGVILLDAGVQGTQILNQSSVYALDPAARSRLTTAYLVPYFLGGAAGSALSALAWNDAGWYGVCGLGAGIGAAVLAFWATE